MIIKNRISIAFILFFTLTGICFTINRIFHPKKNLISENNGVSYSSILFNYGRPDIEYCSTGNGSFTAIYFIEENISYMLIFDPSGKLEKSYLIKDGEFKY